MIAIIANPNAHRFDSEQLKALLLFFRANGVEAEVFFTQKAGDGEIIAGKLANRYSIIAAYGGDGIINEVINADLGESALGILPAGTTNVLAIDLGIGTDPIKAAKILIGNRRKKAYPGIINGRRFMLMAGIGFDGASVAMVRSNLKKRFGKLAYVAAGIEAYLRSTQRKLTVRIGDEEFKALWVIVSKIKRYAGPFVISRDVDIDRPLFDVCIFNPIICGLCDLPLDNALLFSNLHLLPNPFVRHIITGEKIEVSEGFIQVDGDFFARDASMIELDERPIDIVVP